MTQKTSLACGTLAVKRSDSVVTRASVVTSFDARTIVNVNGTVVASPSVDANTRVTSERIDTSGAVVTRWSRIRRALVNVQLTRRAGHAART